MTDRYMILMRDDPTPDETKGPYIQATRREFKTLVAARHYAETVARTREPLIVPMDAVLVAHEPKARTITTPVVNLNGTDPVSLIRQYVTAQTTARVLIDMLGRVSPHGRDYQTAETGRYTIAVAEHRARIEAVQRISEDMEALALDVQRQAHERGMKL